MASKLFKTKSVFENEVLNARWRNNTILFVSGILLYTPVGITTMCGGNNWNQDVFISYLIACGIYTTILFLGLFLKDPELKINLPIESAMYVAVLHQVIILHITKMQVNHVIASYILFFAVMLAMGTLSLRNARIKTLLIFLSLQTLHFIDTPFPKYSMILGYIPLLIWAYIVSIERIHMLEELTLHKYRLDQALSNTKMSVFSWNVKQDHFIWDHFASTTWGWSKDDLPKNSLELRLKLSTIDNVHTLSKIIDHTSSVNNLNFKFQYKDSMRNMRFISGAGKYVITKNGLEFIGMAVNETDDIQMAKTVEEEKARSMSSGKLASLGEMAAGIAHEINNPLAIIQVETERMERFLGKPMELSEKIPKSLRQIQSTLQRIKKIIQGLRSFARDGAQDEMVSENLQTVVEESIELCQQRFSNRNVLLKTAFTADLCNIDCRAVQISQVIINLLTNALDAVQDLQEKWVEISVSKKDSVALLTVTDSGTGIDPAVAQKIFNPFFTTKAIGIGTGLGLSISDGIIKSHHGRLYLDSKSKNTRFVMEIPLSREKRRLRNNIRQNLPIIQFRILKTDMSYIQMSPNPFKSKSVFENEVLNARWKNNMTLVVAGTVLYTPVGVLSMMGGEWHQQIFISYLLTCCYYLCCFVLGFVLRNPELRINLPLELCIYGGVIHQVIVLHLTKMQTEHVIASYVLFFAVMLCMGTLSLRNARIETLLIFFSVQTLHFVDTSFPKYSVILGYIPLLIWTYIVSVERIYMLEELTLHKYRLDQALSNAKMSIFSWNVESDSFSWDHFASTTWGWLKKDLPQNSTEFKRKFSSIDNLQALAKIMESTNSTDNIYFKFQYTDTTGTTRYINGSGKYVTTKNGLEFIGLATDETVHMKMTKSVEEEKARSMSSAKLASLGEMAAGIAHEINNPLAIIQGETERIERCINKPEEIAEKVPKSLKQIQNTLQRIKKIIQGLRSFARDGSQDPMENANLLTITEESIDLCRQRFSNKEITLKTNFTEAPCMINCRSVQISQIIINLLSNALDAVEQVSNRWIEVGIRRNGTTVQLTVTDSGKGIPPEIIQKIFNPFFTTKPIGSGTGLGLSISDGLVKSHKGKLYLDSKSPNTCFVMELPLAVQDQKIDPTKAA